MASSQTATSCLCTGCHGSAKWRFSWSSNASVWSDRAKALETRRKRWAITDTSVAAYGLLRSSSQPRIASAWAGASHTIAR